MVPWGRSLPRYLGLLLGPHLSFMASQEAAFLLWSSPASLCSRGLNFPARLLAFSGRCLASCPHPLGLHSPGFQPVSPCRHSTLLPTGQLLFEQPASLWGHVPCTNGCAGSGSSRTAEPVLPAPESLSSCCSVVPVVRFGAHWEGVWDELGGGGGFCLPSHNTTCSSSQSHRFLLTC